MNNLEKQIAMMGVYVGPEQRELLYQNHIVALLTEIRDDQRALIAALLAPEPSEPPRCAHPEDKRIDLSAMGETQWKCKACGFMYGPVRKGD